MTKQEPKLNNQIRDWEIGSLNLLGICLLVIGYLKIL